MLMEKGNIYYIEDHTEREREREREAAAGVGGLDFCGTFSLKYT